MNELVRRMTTCALINDIRFMAEEEGFSGREDKEMLHNMVAGVVKQLELSK